MQTNAYDIGWNLAAQRLEDGTITAVDLPQDRDFEPQLDEIDLVVARMGRYPTPGEIVEVSNGYRDRLLDESYTLGLTDE